MNVLPLKAEDTTSPFEHFSRNGHYQVGKKIFASKIRALQEATQSKLPVNWHFNDDVYKKVNWTDPVNIPLLELYRMRAQQIREKYDYVILMWSGGADSTTVLDAYVNNNIKLDEIVIVWPITHTRGKYKASLDTAATNMLSEWDYAIEPKLEWLRKHHPNIKVTFIDYLSTPGQQTFDENTIVISANHNFGNISRIMDLDLIIEERQAQHGSVGTVIGIGPVDCAIVNDKHLVTFFNDAESEGVTKSSYTARIKRDIEFFFWSPDLPEIVKAQAHAILAAVATNPNNKRFIKQATMGKDLKLNFTYTPPLEENRAFKKQVIYPGWNQNTFQVRKMEDPIGMTAWQAWFYTNPHSAEYIKDWRGTIESEIALIDIKFYTLYNEALNKSDILNTALHHKTSNQHVIKYKHLSTRSYFVGQILPTQL